jgi:hypothetical protein
MPNKKLTDSEIVKALECCKNGKCEDDCPFSVDREKCFKLDDLVLDLINRLQAENKNLQERNVILKGLVDTQKAENESLFLENQKLLSTMLWGNKKDKKNLLNQIKTEAYKEFADR